MRTLWIGFGNVGETLADVLVHGSDNPAIAGLHHSAVGVVTRSHGALADTGGLDLGAVLAEFRSERRFTEAHPCFSSLDGANAARTLDYDVLIEMSTLSVAERGESASNHVRAALERGRSVVTANKGPIAWHWRDLSRLADARGARLLCEATVMDGAPVFNLARHCLRGNTVLAVEGVLNSTSNVVLCGLERGASLAEAVAAAQRLGVAEADPSLDLDGWDAAVKLCALANVLMHQDLHPEQVRRESVSELDPERVRSAPARGTRVKIICEARREQAGVRARVAAEELPLAHPFAGVEGAGSILRISTDILGTLLIAEQDPDLRSTAYGVLADLIELAG